MALLWPPGGSIASAQYYLLPQGLRLGRIATHRFPREQAGWVCLSVGFSTLKRLCDQPGPRVPSQVPVGGHNSIGTSEYPASDILIYFPSPQVQQGCARCHPWAACSPC